MVRAFIPLCAVFAAPCVPPDEDTPTEDTGTESSTSPTDTSGDDTGTTHSDPVTAMPLLPEGSHLSMMVTFEVLPAATQLAADDRWQSAVDAGMQTARIQLDWADLDVAGTVDTEQLLEQLEDLEAQGLAPYVGVYAVDSEGLVVPADLADETSPTGLVGGLAMDDPSVVERYARVLDAVVPLVVAHGGYALSIANEPEGFIEDKPGNTDAVNAFYQAAIDHAHALDPTLATTVTLTSLVLTNPPEFFDAVVGMVDVVSYNYYCLDLVVVGPDFQFALRGPVETRVPEDIAALVAAADGKEVVFHELGCPAGDDPSIIGTSEDIQAAFFEVAFSEIEAEPLVRAAVVFQLVDWSSELFQIYRGPFEDAGLPAVFIDSFEEWLTTSGMIDFDGQERASWSVFMDHVGG